MTAGPPPPDEPPPASRNAPWSRDAEESLLGAMFLNEDVRARALRETDVSDLWLPNHRTIYEALEWLHAHGEGVDPVTVHDRIAASGAPNADHRDFTRGCLQELATSTPASMNVRSYASVIRRFARARAAIAYGNELAEAGYAGDEEHLDRLTNDATSRLAPEALEVETIDLLAMWALADQEVEEPTKPFVIPACLRQGEVFILTGSEGGGKMTLLRQVAGCIAAGIHPFTGIGEGMEPRRVLSLDLQEDPIDQAAELVKLRRAVGPTYQEGMFHAVSWPDGVDLLSPRGRRKVEGALNAARPDLVICGPLVKTFRTPEGRSRYSEDVIDEVTDIWDDWMTRYDFALMLEAHSGNDRGSDADWRARGSSVWRSWPAFSHGLKLVSTDPREAELVRARPDRYANRAWPTRLFGNPAYKLPWQASNDDFARVCRAMGLHWLLGEGEQMLMDPYDPDGGQPF